MDLFASSGMITTSGGGKGTQKRLALRLPHVPLFNQKTVDKALASAAINLETIEKKAVAYAKKARSVAFQDAKETAARPTFFSDILQDVLGYKGVREGDYSVAYEYPLRRKPVDAALGTFNTDDGDFVHAPFEMKGPRDAPDLDKILQGRGMSPVQQAWDYAADAPNAKWVLVSNCLEIRLYAFGRGRDAYELFDLTRLDDPDELRRLVFLLGERRFLSGETEALLAASDSALKTITNELYADYKQLRIDLVGYLVNAADGPKLALQKAIEAAQKLLDRALFIAFASGNAMLPEKLFGDAISLNNPFDPKPKWFYARTVFRWIDKGNRVADPRYDVWPYNGGLFADDPDVDTIILPDQLAEAVNGLFKWDYGKDISVNVLGHIFEQSIGHLEELRTGAALQVSQRKKEGVVYTPEHVTSFIVDQTIGKTLKERFAEHYSAQTGKPLPEDLWFEGIDPETEKAVWLGYLSALRALTIVDPACGSGAFLVAAFDTLLAEYRRVTERLADLDAPQGFDIADEILLNNLHGVDLNVESVEITRLALWLKSARRHHRLAKLDQSIQAGNSLINDAKAAPRPFDWDAAFPDIMAQGGFDIVIGNPPYVRAENIGDQKSWLASKYKVGSDQSDLSAYFYEKGFEILNTRGRLGYISTSSFFRAGYGHNLRSLLAATATIEVVIDFGDVQIFEDVTTYPAILTAKKQTDSGISNSDLTYLNIRTEAPEDLGRTFRTDSRTMPQTRLSVGSWQFEDGGLAEIRSKIINKRPMLKDVYGAPKSGVKTGRTEVFCLPSAEARAIFKSEPNSQGFFHDYLRGDDIERWCPEPSAMTMLVIPNGWTRGNLLSGKRIETGESFKIFSLKYPILSSYLHSKKEQAETRSDQGEYWWELRPCDYYDKLDGIKMIYPEMSQGPKFCIDKIGSYINNKCFFMDLDYGLLGYLNSKLFWFWAFGEVSPLRGGKWRLELREQHMSVAPVPFTERSELDLIASLAEMAAGFACDKQNLSSSFHHRLLTDLAVPETKLSRKLKDFHTLDFSEFRAEVKKALKADIPVKERADWESQFNTSKAEVNRLAAEITVVEREIDRLVYDAFELAPDEIALLEKSLEGQF